MYTPDRWLLIKINGKDPHYRVFASWYGGYLGSDSWRMNSGVTRVTEDEQCYHFEGSSGSVYHCYKNSHGISGYGSSVLDNIIEKQPELNIEIVNEDVNVMELFAEN
jgi:hypothetical protein